MSWLVTGGAGYVGAHVVRALVTDGADVVVLDDLSSSDGSRVPDVPLITGSVRDGALVRRVLAEHDVDGVMHIAARKSVAESVADPLLYYTVNVDGLASVLAACQDAGVRRFVFSSSAAVYGMPDVELVTEATPCAPVSPYGRTKLIGEQMLADCAQWGLASVSLRYFNVAGTAARELADTGTANLVPLVFRALGRGRSPVVFGDDYPTPDGTCVRDYVHVADVADAHLAASAALDGSRVYNIGRGQGASVLEVLDVVRSVTGVTFTPDVRGRRAGDPARVVASADRARAELGFTATRSLEDMVRSAWDAW